MSRDCKKNFAERGNKKKSNYKAKKIYTFFKKGIDKVVFILYNYIAVKRFVIFTLFDLT